MDTFITILGVVGLFLLFLLWLLLWGMIWSFLKAILKAIYNGLKAWRTKDEKARRKMTKAWDELKVLTRLPRESLYEPDDIGATVAIEGKTFVMKVTGGAVAVKFPTGAYGVVIHGKVCHGTVQSGDELQIRGRYETKTATVFDVEGSVVPGKKVRLAIKGVTDPSDVRVGDVVEKQ